MHKPNACIGCPFYGDGEGFVPDEIREDCKIHCIAQNPGEAEEYQERPLCGRIGFLTMQWFENLGLKREDMSLGNVIKCRWNKSNNLPRDKKGNLLPIAREAIRHCMSNYLLPFLHLPKANVTALVGDVALEALGGRQGISEWNGSVWVEGHGPLAGRKVVAVIHPANLFRDLRWRTALKLAFARVAREARQEGMVIQYKDNFRQGVGIDEFIGTLEGLKEKRIVLDVETNYKKAVECTLHTIGIGWTENDAMNIEWNGLDAQARGAIVSALSGFRGEFVTATPFDYTVLSLRGVSFNWDFCHDLALLHSRYDIELPHTVAFIAQMWSDRPYWKWMNLEAPLYYNCLDCVGEWESFERLLGYCERNDKVILECYDNDRKLLPVCVELQRNGLPFDIMTYKAEKAFYEQRRGEIESELGAQFVPAIKPEDVSRCSKHPRFSGKTIPALRKGEMKVCTECTKVREEFKASRPLNLRARTQLAERLGLKKGASVAKGKLAKLAKKTGDPKIMRILEFKRDETIVTRYYNDPEVTKRTGRVHSNYSMHAAKHRWSSSDPNAQQFRRPEE